MVDAPLLRLNDDWRLAHDGRMQWILERRDRTDLPPRASDRWRGRRFHVERAWLLASIAELCGAVDTSALALIRSWPSRYDPRAHAGVPQPEPVEAR